ncbi:MAG TPA: DUF3800 domain-containing protein [Candidatus Acidoferrum sp.]|nr:DUF3800 domain-containing protein [Candidatus Acidoferrum sp.]
MDESCDEQGAGLFVVGGILMRGVPSFELERKWEKLRKRPDIDIAYFKASECKSGRGQFAKFVATPGSPTQCEHQRLDSISREFLQLIPKEEHIIVQGVGIVQSDFCEVIQDAYALAVLGDSPYRLAYDFAMIQCAWAMKQLEQGIKRDKENVAFGGSFTEYVSFVCDKHEQHSLVADEAFRNLKQTNPNAAKYMGTFDSADDKHVEVLQAADAVAFEIRRVLGFAFGGYSVLRAQFRDLADPGKVFLITHTTKEQLSHIVANHNPGEPFKLDSIMEQQIIENIRFPFL